LGSLCAHLPRQGLAGDLRPTEHRSAHAALASSDPKAALNPFIDGPMASPGVLASIYSNTLITNFDAQATIVDAFTRGPVVQLPAGALNALVGAEYEKSRFERGFDANRTARAVFMELRAPLFASTDERGEKREVLAVQGAARYDDYSDFGSKTTWQAGVEFRPIEICFCVARTRRHSSRRRCTTSRRRSRALPSR